MITVKIRSGYRCVFGPIEATGRTKTEARTKALDEAESRLLEVGDPIIIRHHDHYAIVYYHAGVGAWANAILFPDRGPDPHGHIQPAISMGWDSKGEAEQDARIQLAQLTMDGSIIRNEQDKENFRWWIGWQRAYRAAEQKGLEGEDAREWANKHEREFRPVC